MRSLALYIHWPFCKSKCPYCDFNSHVRNHIDEQVWDEAFAVELTRMRSLTGPRRLTSLFFGGGTPSLMSPHLAGKIIDTATKLWQPEPDIEITLEANPTSIEVGKFKALSAAGVNRVSIGVQSFNQEDLHFLGREHSSDEAKQAIRIAQQNFTRVSFDLIYARPNQTIEAWNLELEQALAFGTDHLSLYQLTIEQGTAFAHKYARQEFMLPEENLATDLYQQTIDTLGAKGLKIYEISNFAHPGQESKHNLAYWTYEDYAGVGPGAHGRLTLADGSKIATKQFKAPETWLKQVRDGSGTQESLSLSVAEQATEHVMMGLRLFQPFDLAKLPLPWYHAIDAERLEVLMHQGLVQQQGSSINLTVAARLCLNEVLRYLSVVK
ncbi:radical SAM family heme chaperone HemW [Candidatus Paracaedibacter symbiosus]|uniref:radical SAM family heme chaperone HemW n=1 Tax=Candidatus Paracaedibacter symbiosus TaxID=244582 RepID=UPI0005098B0C|nr:radical SAM family heme chaperone HemW [Candidatus Paracaedibacter symbiosus]